MHHMIFEFPSEKELRDTVHKLWETHGVSGEMQIRPLKDGKWRMEVYSEKELRDSTLEKFAAFMIEAE